MSQADAEAARLRDEALGTFKEQTDRPLTWYKGQEAKQELADHPTGLQSEKPGPGTAGGLT